MKMMRYMMMAVLALIAVGCDQVLTNEYPYGQEFVLANGQRALVGGEALIRVVGVTEGRCPAPVECFWEGNATVDLEMRLSGYAPERFTLNTYHSYTRDTTIRGINVALVDLAPYPQSANFPTDPDDFQVRLRVSR